MVVMFDIFPAEYAVNSYAPLLIFFTAIAAVSCILAFLPAFLTARQKLQGTTAPYECGIDIEDGHIAQFDIRFYLVAMLFLVFDCEVVFLFPWAVVLKSISCAAFLSAVAFLGVLAIGLLYEWQKKSLDW